MKRDEAGEAQARVVSDTKIDSCEKWILTSMFMYESLRKHIDTSMTDKDVPNVISNYSAHVQGSLVKPPRCLVMGE